MPTNKDLESLIDIEYYGRNIMVEILSPLYRE